MFTLVILTVMSMLFVLPATPAAAAGEKSITLAWVDFIEGKGVVVVFNVKGKFDSFDGSVKFGNNSYPLSCNLRDDGKLACVVSKGSKLVGKSLSGSINGFAFTTGQVPKPNYCYDVFDAWDDGEYVLVHQVGTHCQEEAAVEGDGIWYTLPEWGGYYYWYTYTEQFIPELPGYWWWEWGPQG